MARLNKQFGFTGGLGNVSAYSRRDMEGEVLLRMKGGPPIDKIKHSPAFASIRRNNTEMGGAAKACKAFRVATRHTHLAADYNFTPKLSGLFRLMINEDKEGTAGERSIYISRNKEMVEGFSFTRNKSWESIVVAPVYGSISREEGKARLLLPALVPGSSFRSPWQLPFYRLILQGDVVSDYMYSEKLNHYQPMVDLSNHIWGAVHTTEWLPCSAERAAEEVLLDITKGEALPDAVTLVVSVSIEFGTLAAGGSIEYKKYTGAGKVWRMG